jgi:putative zinc finger/helix-turn-helix YgiT family protein
METQVKCPECNEGTLEARRENRSYKESGLPNIVLLDVEVSHCPACGADLVSLPRLSELHRTIALALIDKPSRLVPGEIRYLRKSLGWSGADFARSLHVDPATVSRWESENAPQSMSDSNELVLRLAVALGQRIESYGTDRLSEVARENAAPLRLRVRRTQHGWQPQSAA